MEKHIGVISRDLQDFMNWRDEKKLVPNSTHTRKMFRVNETTFYCIYKPTDLVSLTLDEIVETKNAKTSDTYGIIMEIAKPMIKSNDQLKIKFN